MSGYSYRIDVKGDTPAAPGGTLGDTYVELRDASGNSIGASDIGVTIGDFSDDNIAAAADSGAGNNSKLEIDVKRTGTYYIEVSGHINTGTYTVQATILHGGNRTP